MSDSILHFKGPLDFPHSQTMGNSSWLRPELVVSWKEIILVLTIFIGPYAAKSGWKAGHGSSNHYFKMFLSDYYLLVNGTIEAGMLALFLGYLSWRGWRKADFKINATVANIWQIVSLAIITQIGNAITVLGLVVLLFVLQAPHASFTAYLLANGQHLEPHSVQVSWCTIVSTMVLNAFFEELICIGYAFNQFAAKCGPLFALLLTVLLRMSCHTYQGPVHMLGIGTAFMISGLWYWGTRNLWPLIGAHTLLDIGSISLLKLIRG